MKNMFAKQSAQGKGVIGKKTGGRVYNFKNSSDVTDLHHTIGDELNLDKKARNNFMNASKGNKSGTLPNVIFDITGKTSKKLDEIADLCKGQGYKTSLVWVITNREVAMMRNLLRARVVGEELFHDIHNEVSKTLLKYLQSENVSKYDEAWLIFSGVDKVKELSPEQEKELFKNSAIKLVRKGKTFEISDELERKIVNWLGPNEDDVKNPKTYKSFGDVKKELDKHLVTREEERKNYKHNRDERIIKRTTKPEGYGQLNFRQ